MFSDIIFHNFLGNYDKCKEIASNLLDEHLKKTPLDDTDKALYNMELLALCYISENTEATNKIYDIKTSTKDNWYDILVRDLSLCISIIIRGGDYNVVKDTINSLREMQVLYEQQWISDIPNKDEGVLLLSGLYYFAKSIEAIAKFLNNEICVIAAKSIVSPKMMSAIKLLMNCPNYTRLYDIVSIYDIIFDDIMKKKIMCRGVNNGSDMERKSNEKIC